MTDRSRVTIEIVQMKATVEGVLDDKSKNDGETEAVPYSYALVGVVGQGSFTIGKSVAGEPASFWANPLPLHLSERIYRQPGVLCWR